MTGNERKSVRESVCVKESEKENETEKSNLVNNGL